MQLIADIPSFVVQLVMLLVTLYFFNLARRGKSVMDLLDDEESRMGLMKVLASEIRQSLQFSLMGQASGDAKKHAKAKNLVSQAIVHEVIPSFTGAPGIIKALMRFSGINEWLEEDPEAIQYLLSAGTELLGQTDLSKFLPLGAGGSAFESDQPPRGYWE